MYVAGTLRPKLSRWQTLVVMGPGSRGACHRARIRATRWLGRDDVEVANYRTTPELNPALRRGGLISFFRKQCGSLPTYPARAKVQARHLFSALQAALQTSSLSLVLSAKLRKSPPARSIEVSTARFRGSTTPAPRTPETQHSSFTRAGTVPLSQQ